MQPSRFSILGNFTNSAIYYDDRPRYDDTTLDILSSLVRTRLQDPVVVDVGAGTGHLTRELASRSFGGKAIEPNDAMRAEGIKRSVVSFPFDWSEGSGEATGLADSSVDWLLMGNAFHWTEKEAAFEEFQRILRPGGLFTPIWVMLDTDHDETVQVVDNILTDSIPAFERHSRVVLEFIESLENGGAGFRSQRLFIESRHSENMSIARYLNMWRSRNDVQSALSANLWQAVIARIHERLGDEDVSMKLRTYAWMFFVD